MVEIAERARGAERDTDAAMVWRLHEFFFVPVRIEGRLVWAGPVMRRRKQSGAWEYRALTESEQSDFTSRDAW